VIVMVLALGALTGCGSKPGSQGRQRAPVALVASDASPSFRPFVGDCARDFERVATAVAERRGDIYGAALVTGNPFGQPLIVQAHLGATPPPSIQGNDQLESAWRQRRARGLRPAFARMVATPTLRSGSPVLTALERVGSFRRQRAGTRPFWAVICSDLANVGDGMDVLKPISDSQVHSIVRRWTGPLRGLRGADLYLIGAGRLKPHSTVLPASIQQVERAIRKIAKRNGAHVRLIDTQLGLTFPLTP
jgi:hypothetical protein